MQHYVIDNLNKDTFSSIPFVPTLCIGFYISGEEKYFESQCKKLKKKFPNIDIIACSTESNLQDTFPFISHNKIQLACIDIAKDAYEINHIEHENPKFDLKKNHTYDAIIFSPYENKDIEDFLFIAKNKLGHGKIFGALSASRDINHVATSVYYNGEFFTENLGTIMWFIDKKYYDVQGLSMHTFMPIGLELNVTKFKGKELLEIESNPALEMIEDIIGKLDDEGIANFEYSFFISEQKDTNFNSLASIQSIDRKNKSITLYKDVNSKMKITLSIPALKKEQKIRMRQLINTGYNNGFSFLFTCFAFKQQWKELESLYIMQVAKQLKTHFIGCHTFGEIGPLNTTSSSYLQNQTLTLINIQKKKNTHA